MPETGVRVGGVDSFRDGRFRECPKCRRSTAKASPREVRDQKGKECRDIGCDDQGVGLLDARGSGGRERIPRCRVYCLR